jgi:hypothetical protein
VYPRPGLTALQHMLSRPRRMPSVACHIRCGTAGRQGSVIMVEMPGSSHHDESRACSRGDIAHFELSRDLAGASLPQKPPTRRRRQPTAAVAAQATFQVAATSLTGRPRFAALSMLPVGGSKVSGYAHSLFVKHQATGAPHETLLRPRNHRENAIMKQSRRMLAANRIDFARSLAITASRCPS